MRTPLTVSLLVVLSLLASTAALAQWQPDGIAVSTAQSDQWVPVTASDGAGGAIVAWIDYRNGNYDIYAQRIDASGAALWTANGVALCTAAQEQSNPRIVADGAGGAIVTWSDGRSGNFDIYAQRISASGAVQWTANGVALCTATNTQFLSTIASDGAGGGIVTWYDFRSGLSDIYAQRINVSGAVQWTANGVALCTATGDQVYPEIASDGASGAIVTWVDNRSGNFDIYARRINASGVAQWTANGEAVCTAANTQTNPQILPDGTGGAIIAWPDSRNGNSDIYAQRINATGSAQWTLNGVAVCVTAYDQSNPRLVADGTGGAILSWRDARSGSDYDIYAQRLNASGTVQWPSNGLALCTLALYQLNPAIASDGAGGAIVAWADLRSSSSYDVYAQRVSNAGVVQWTYAGEPLCTATGDQTDVTIVSDGSGGAIVVWPDLRSGGYDVYAQRVEGRFGYWGHPEPVVTSVKDIPNDQGGKVAVNWLASGRDRPAPRTIGHYSVWRAVDPVTMSQNGAAPLALTDINRVALDTHGPVYVQLSTSDYYWELVGTQAAQGWAGYSFAASTRADSVFASAGNEFFMVAAHYQYDDYVAFPSNVLSGHSVDNLAPAAPLYLTAQRVGADVHLKWNRVHVPDLKNYSVFRATSSGVTPVPVNFLADSNDSLLVDPGAPATALYYIVTAKDVHENQSVPSNEASVSPTTSVGDTPALTTLMVLQNHPNPFTGSTELRIGLPAVADVAIEVYDVAGRRVRTQALSQQAAGWQRVAFDGRDDAGQRLASGVYFYRVTANGTTVTNKMVITR